MEVVAQNAEYVERIENLYELCRSVEKILPEFEPSFTIKITSEFQKDLYLHSSEKEQSEMDKEGIPELNGVVILPKTEELHFTILISSKQFEEDQVVHTAIHEFTHLYDYCRYFEDNGNVYISDERERKSKCFVAFNHWTEYHAKRLGTLVFSIYRWHQVCGDTPPPDGKYPFQKVEFRSEDLREKIEQFNVAHKTKSYRRNYLFWDLLQELMGYYGRLSVFQKTGSNEYADREFPHEALVNTLGIPCIQLYHLLLELDGYENAKRRLRQVEDLIDSIVCAINLKELTMPFCPTA